METQKSISTKVPSRNAKHIRHIARHGVDFGMQLGLQAPQTIFLGFGDVVYEKWALQVAS